jgi:hypothetical protein
MPAELVNQRHSGTDFAVALFPSVLARGAYNMEFCVVSVSQIRVQNRL